VNSNSEIRIVFEDEWLVVVEKPAGMVVNNSRTWAEETVQNWFARISNSQFLTDKNTEFGQRGGVVHRLDKETSGLLLLAKNQIVYNDLKRQFMERIVHKMYSCLAHGILDPEKGVISVPIVRHPKLWGKYTVGSDLSRTAITEWKRVMNYEAGALSKEKYSLLELKPITGRTHQLRVQLKYLGHPVVSDSLYLGRKQLKEDLKWCPRLWLHASRLQFKHPQTGKIMVFESGIPSDLQQALEKLVH
jgi:23S rRNA pseudouridine1911/1915/1917 synthase